MNPNTTLPSLLILLVAMTPFTELNAASGDSGLPERLVLKASSDSELSPYTGYTRTHWLEITERLIAGFMPYFNPETGLPNPGVSAENGHYDLISHVGKGDLEAFERTLVMVGIYLAATGQDRVPGYQGSIAKPYQEQILRGTNPDDPWYWGEHPDYQVKGTNLAFVVQVCPAFFWDPFSETEQKRILTLLQGLTLNRAYDNNHWYFHMTPVPLLERYGMGSNREFLTTAFDRILNWYHGDGWFMDGSNGGFDYYNLWGFQLFNHMLMAIDQPWRMEFGERVERTTRQFEKSLPYLFGRDGANIPFGRSISYRFAVNSAVGYALLSGMSGLPPGQARRMASGNLKYFWEHGAMSEAGLLEPGFHGPNTAVAQPYTERAASYWAAHGLVPLLLPADHPFWTAEEQAMPADGKGGRVPLTGAEMLLNVRSDGDARLYPVGQHFGHLGAWQRGIKYAQLSYSSTLGYCATGEGGPSLGAGRNGFSYTGKIWHYRSQPRMREVTKDHLVSEESMPPSREEEAVRWFRDFGRIITHTLVGDSGEIHVFWHTSARPLFLHLGGYGISVPHGESPAVDSGKGRIAVTGGDFQSEMRIVTTPPGAFHHEWVETRPGWNHSHLFGGRGAYPYWRSSQPVKSNQPVVIFVEGARSDSAIQPDIKARMVDGNLHIQFDGRDFLVDVPY